MTKLHPKELCVSIWVGTLDKPAFEEYLSGGDAGQFERDAGVELESCDGTSEVNWTDEPHSISKLLAGHSWADSFSSAAAEAARSAGIDSANAIVVLYDHQWSGRWPKRSPLRFLGSFSYQLDPGPLAPRLRPDDHRGAVNAVAIFPDGALAITGARPGELRLWDLRTGRCIQQVASGHADWVLRIVTSGARAISCECELMVWELEPNGIRGWRLGDHDGFQIGDVAIDSTGRFAASACVDGRVGIWDLGSRALIRFLRGEDGSRFSRVCFSDDGSVLAAGATGIGAEAEGLVCLWRIDDERCQWSERAPGQFLNALDSQGRFVVASGHKRSIFVRNLATAETRLLEGHEDSIECVHIARDGALAVSASRDATVRTWDLATFACTQVLRGHTDQISSLALSGDGVALSGSRDGSSILWDLRNGAALARFSDAPERPRVERWKDEPFEHRSVAMSSDGTRVVIGETSGRVHVLELRDGALAPVAG